MKPLDPIETRGDVHFFRDNRGVLFQQIGSGEVFKVKGGIITYRPISRRKGIEIRYQSNGTKGFCLFRNGRLLKDNLWTIADAERTLDELSDKFELLSKIPVSYKCGDCENSFSKLKVGSCPNCGSANYIPNFR